MFQIWYHGLRFYQNIFSIKKKKNNYKLLAKYNKPLSENLEEWSKLLLGESTTELASNMRPHALTWHCSVVNLFTMANILTENPHLSSLKITEYRTLESDRGILEERETEMGSYKFCLNICGWPLSYAWHVADSKWSRWESNDWAEICTASQEAVFVCEVSCSLHKTLTFCGRPTESTASKTSVMFKVQSKLTRHRKEGRKHDPPWEERTIEE